MRVSVTIAKTVADPCLHERVRYGHSCDDHDIHDEGQNNHALIEADESIVLRETIADQVRLDRLEEVPVECSVNKEVQKLLNAIPVFVDDMIMVVDLETRWDPDIEDTDVDCGDENGSGNHDVPRALSIRHNDTDTVDDDLQQ